jgi:hypothetical protein
VKEPRISGVALRQWKYVLIRSLRRFLH